MKSTGRRLNMAGIGFELRRAIRDGNVIRKSTGYFSAAFTCFGGMLIGIVLLVLLRFASKASGVDEMTGNLFMSYTTGTMFLSMLVCASMAMALSRYVSDMLYMKRYGKIMPSLIGVILVALVGGGIVYGFFINHSYTEGMPVLQLLMLFAVLCVCWIMMNYISLLRDYKQIVFAFLAALVLAAALTGLFWLNRTITLNKMLWVVVFAYSVVDVWLFRALYQGFPTFEGRLFSFVKYIRLYPALVFVGLAMSLGVLGHFWVTWYTAPDSTIMQGLFAMNLNYDFPAIVAYFSTIPAMVYFITLFETAFYHRYREYLEALGGHGTTSVVDRSRESMVGTMRKGLRNYSAIQIIACLLSVTEGAKLLAVMNIGMTERMLDTFRMFCVGYALYSIGNILVLLQLYYVDEHRAAIGAVSFAIVTGLATWANLKLELGVNGIGLCLGALVLVLVSGVGLVRCLGNLEQHILCETSYPELIEGHKANRPERAKARVHRRGAWTAVAYFVSIALIAFSGFGLINQHRLEAMILHFQPAVSAEPLEEPGVGFAPWANSDEAEGMNTSLVYVELKWADWEPERGVYDTEYVNEEFRLEEYRAQNRQVVFRFVCDEPTEEEHMDIPQWLYDEINGDGDWYSTSYGKGFSPNYANETIIEAHKNAITALGAQYGKDNFFYYVQLGSLGHWGEYHVNRAEGVTPLPLYDVRIRYVEPYLSAFPNAHIMMRYPLLEANKYGFGLYNDMTGDYEETVYWMEQMKGGGTWEQTGAPEQAEMTEAWETHPIGGEFASSHSDRYFVLDNLKETLDLLSQSHQSFIGPKTIIGESETDYSASEAKILTTIGYRYRVSQASIDMTSEDQIGLSIEMTNDGNAPIYDYYEVQCAIKDEDGREIWADSMEDIDLRNLLPQEVQTQRYAVSRDTFDDDVHYYLTVSVVDGKGNPYIPLAMQDVFQDKEYIIADFDIR